MTKFISQMALAVVAIVVLVAGVTYMSYYSTGSTSGTKTVIPIAKGEKIELFIPEKVVQWQPEYAGDFEVGTTGTYDFWFQNKNEMPIALGVSYKSCKCSELFVCVLNQEQTANFLPQAAAVASSEIGTACLGAPGLAELFRDTDKTAGWLGPQTDGLGAKLPKLQWQPTNVDEKDGVTIQPQCGGFLRVAFKGEKMNAARLAINLWSQPDTGSPSPRSDYRLEIPIRFVPAVQVSQPDINLEEINFGEEKTREFLCYSSTRTKFSLQARESGNDPCFTCTCTLLTPDECAKAAEFVKARVLAGYSVKVTVRERVSEGAQLDWGPFLRKLALSSDAEPDEAFVEMRGRVLGEIMVGTDEDKGAVLLGEFSSKNGKTKTIRLTSLQAASDLQFERIEPPTLNYVKIKSLTKVQQSSGGRSEWDLCVEAAPGCPPGKLPRNSAVILKILGKNPRNVRVPVKGIAFQQ